MNRGVRTILLLVAVVLFVLSVFADDSSNVWSWGLAAFAGAFLSEAVCAPSCGSSRSCCSPP